MRTKRKKRSRLTGAGLGRKVSAQEVQSMSTHTGESRYAQEFLRRFFELLSPRQSFLRAFSAYFAYFAPVKP